jgi:hypothetical protein
MAGYSGKPLAEKLGLKTGQRVALLHAPAEFPAALEPLPEGIHFVGAREGGAAAAAAAAAAGAVDVALLFSREAAALEPAFGAAVKRLAPGGMIWVAWPKKAAKQPTDLTEDVVRRIGLATGLVDVKVCGVTEVWSGLKLLRRRAPR